MGGLKRIGTLQPVVSDLDPKVRGTQADPRIVTSIDRRCELTFIAISRPTRFWGGAPSAFAEPGLDFHQVPPDASRPNLDALGKLASPFQA